MADAPTPLLSARALSHTYGESPVLAKVTLKVDAGELVALAGRNGAGKSTLMRCLAGWARPAEGEVRILGRPVDGAERWVRQHAALVPDTPSFWDDLTAWEHLRFIAGLHRLRDWRERAEGLLRRLGLEGQRDLFPAAYSRGMRYKLALALALLLQPPLLLLDEPFGPLDAESAASLWAMLRDHAAAGGAVLFSCHQLPPNAEPSRYVILERGRVALAGTPAELRRDLGLEAVTPEHLLGAAGAADG